MIIERQDPKASYCIFQLTNVLSLLSGIAILGCSIYLNYQTHQWKTIEVGLLAYSSCIILLAVIANCVRNRPGLVKFYFVSMMIVFLLGLTISIAAVVQKDKLLDIAMSQLPPDDRQKTRNLIESHINISLYILFTIVAIQFLAILFANCYRRQLKSANNQYLLDKQHQQDQYDIQKRQKEIQDKVDRKRDMLNQKYPQYYGHTNKR